METVLIIEDDSDIGSVYLQMITEETTYCAIVYSVCQQALHFVKNVTPTLVILDYQLPYMTGIEFHDHFRMMQHLQHVPVLMMSANLPHQQLAQRGIVGLKKPVDMDDFLSTIEMLVASSLRRNRQCKPER